MKRLIVSVFFLLTIVVASAQSVKQYHLGNGLVVFEASPAGLKDNRPIAFYEDSTLKKFTAVTIDQTTCPRCMVCAEPEQYYEGPVHPFLCGNGGMCFITVARGAGWREIITDKTGKRAFLKTTAGRYYSWRDWMILQGKKGEYIVPGTYETADSTLYDKPYDLQQLPAPDAKNRVGLNYKNPGDLRLIPVDLKGNWMKVRITSYSKKTLGYAWLIWRTETDWTFGFKWHAD